MSKSPKLLLLNAVNLDHGELKGLLDDDHTQYLLLAGRGGQTIDDSLTVTGEINDDEFKRYSLMLSM